MYRKTYMDGEEEVGEVEDWEDNLESFPLST
jgi:hypothetical protein